MRLTNILQMCKFAGFCLACLFFAGTLQAQEAKPKVKSIDIALLVTDSLGKPVAGAAVVVGEGFIHKETAQDGKVTFNASATDFITITHAGFEKAVVVAGELPDNKTVVLTQAGLFLTADDAIPLPFMTVKKRRITGSTGLITGSMLEKYPSTDIRNAFTGLATGLDVRELNGSPGISAEEELAVFGIGEKVNIAARGLNVMYIIDEIPTDITEMPLDPGEIESVTVIKDVVGKSMYGPAGANGVIFIKTKRGRQNERILNANVEYGVNTIDRMPGWVSGAEYAKLNNMARANSGLEPLYDESDIAAYAKNDPYDMYHPSVNYRNMMLKNSMNFQRFNISSTGGSDKVQYYSYLGYAGEGDLYKIGAKADYNRLNARSNIDIKINDFLRAQFDFFGGLSFRRSPNYGFDPDFTSESSSNPVLSITEFPSVLNDIISTPPIAFPVYANNDPELKSPWYAVSSTYGSNPVGGVMKNGYYTESGRNGTFNVALEYDMKALVKGLKSKTYIGFSAFNLVRIGKAENYTAYRADPSTTATGADTILLVKVHDGVDQASQAKLHDFYYQRFAAYENLNYARTFGHSDLQASLTYYLSRISRNGIEEPQRQMISVLSALYSWKNKYHLQGVLNYSGSSSFSKDARYFLSRSGGLGWVVSEENFLKDSKWIDYLKIRGEYGVMGFESFRSPFGYRSDWNFSSSTSEGTTFGPYSSNQWFGSATDTYYRTYPGRTGNPLLNWEKRRELNAGIELLMAKRKLYLEVNYYNHLRDGMIASLAKLPYIAGISSWRPAFNYNQARYSGVEATLRYSKNRGDFQYSLTGRASLPKMVWERYDEPNYRYDYQRRTGRDMDEIRGQTYLGRFSSDEETMQVPQLFDDELHAGDLKYQDLNEDGVVDDNDESKIGNSYPRLLYSFELRLKYKRLEISAIGTGRAFYDILLSNRYFWNGWGDNNYSRFVADNVLNNGDAYPRLTYYRVNNNFESSSFWLRKAGFFKIQDAELAWNVPVEKLQWSNVRGLRLFVRGANLYTFSKIKDVDPEATSAGVYDYPLFRTITGGLKLTF